MSLTVAIASLDLLTISADRFVGHDEFKDMLGHPKIFTNQHVAIASAGTLRAYEYLADNIEHALNLPDTEAIAKRLSRWNNTHQQDAQFLILSNHSLWTVDAQGGYYELSWVGAIGGGYQYALGSFHNNPNTHKAIQAACHWHAQCSTPVDTFALQDGKWEDISLHMS